MLTRLRFYASHLPALFTAKAPRAQVDPIIADTDDASPSVLVALAGAICSEGAPNPGRPAHRWHRFTGTPEAARRQHSHLRRVKL